MGALEDTFQEDQHLHAEEDLFFQEKTGKPLRRVFHWRLNTPKASKTLLIMRHFNTGTVIVVISQPDSHFSFSDDFKCAFSVLCGDYDLDPNKTACFERFLERPEYKNCRQKYIQFCLTGNTVTREIISGGDFDHLIDQLTLDNE